MGRAHPKTGGALRSITFFAPLLPLSVLNNVAVDHTESLSKMGDLLTEIILNTEPIEVEVPKDIRIESAIDQRVSTRVEDM